jgi:hypothetical protein
MLEHILLVLTLIAGAMGSVIGADLGRRSDERVANRLIAAGFGFAVGAGALWLFFQGFAKAWHGGSWLGVVAILGALSALTIVLRWLDERCPSYRSISSYCPERELPAPRSHF